MNSGLVLALCGIDRTARRGRDFAFRRHIQQRGQRNRLCGLEHIFARRPVLRTNLLGDRTAWPGSLTGPDPVTELTAVYYSFVTLATLGYGDYLPRTDIARGIATFEVIGGQLFLAVMVARLIGAFGTDEELDRYSAA